MNEELRDQIIATLKSKQIKGKQYAFNIDKLTAYVQQLLDEERELCATLAEPVGMFGVSDLIRMRMYKQPGAEVQ
jgi:hypothetical protein